MAKIIIFGTSQTAEIAHYYFKHDSDHDVVGFTVDGDHLQESSFLSLPVVAFEQINEEFPSSDFSMHVAVSYHDLNKFRQRKYEEAKHKGYKLESYVSSRAGLVGPVHYGDNCLILENQSIQPGVILGNDVALFGGTIIGHHSAVGDHCWITSEVAIAGNVTIGKRCFIGVNATIGHMITVGNDCFVGAGTLTTKSLDDKSVVIARDTDVYPLDSERFFQITKMK